MFIHINKIRFFFIKVQLVKSAVGSRIFSFQTPTLKINFEIVVENEKIAKMKSLFHKRVRT